MDRPLIMSAPMVRALLAGTKSQTRCILKPQPIPFAIDKAGTLCDVGLIHAEGDKLPRITTGRVITRQGIRFAVDDRLWVRESCKAEELSRPPKTRPATARERKATQRTVATDFNDLDGCDGVRYAADDTWVRIQNTREAADAWLDLYYYRGRGKDGIGNPVPSIHMPRWASRLTLTVTDVRVQRLQEISEADAQAEGLKRAPGGWWSGADGQAGPTPRAAYGVLWNSIHGHGSWQANPWVAAISFATHHGNIDTMPAPRALTLPDQDRR